MMLVVVYDVGYDTRMIKRNQRALRASSFM